MAVQDPFPRAKPLGVGSGRWGLSPALGLNVANPFGDTYGTARATYDTALGDANAMGLETEPPRGFFSSTVDFLDRFVSAGAGFGTGLVGADLVDGDGNLTDRSDGGLDDAWRRLVRGARGEHIGWGDTAALRMDENDSKLERFAKGAGAFAGDVLTDPLTYISFGTSIGRGAASRVAAGQLSKAMGDDLLREAGGRWAAKVGLEATEDNAVQLGKRALVAELDNETIMGSLNRMKEFDLGDLKAAGIDNPFTADTNLLVQQLDDDVLDSIITAGRPAGTRDVAGTTVGDIGQAGSSGQSLLDIAVNTIGEGAYRLGGARRLRTELNRLFGDKGDEVFAAMTSDVRGGARWRIPGVRENVETGGRTFAPFTNKPRAAIPLHPGQVGGGQVIDSPIGRALGFDKVIDGVEQFRRFTATTGFAQAVSKLGGRYGELAVKTLAKVAEDASGETDNPRVWSRLVTERLADEGRERSRATATHVYELLVRNVPKEWRDDVKVQHQINRLVTHPELLEGGLGAPAGVDDQVMRFARELRAFYDRWGHELEDAGVIPPGAAGTGNYVPHMVSDEYLDTVRKFRVERGMAASGVNVSSGHGNTKSRLYDEFWADPERRAWLEERGLDIFELEDPAAFNAAIAAYTNGKVTNVFIEDPFEVLNEYERRMLTLVSEIQYRELMLAMGIVFRDDAFDQATVRAIADAGGPTYYDFAGPVDPAEGEKFVPGQQTPPDSGISFGPSPTPRLDPNGGNQPMPWRGLGDIVPPGDVRRPPPVVPDPPSSRRGLPFPTTAGVPDGTDVNVSRVLGPDMEPSPNLGVLESARIWADPDADTYTNVRDLLTRASLAVHEAGGSTSEELTRTAEEAVARALTLTRQLTELQKGRRQLEDFAGIKGGVSLEDARAATDEALAAIEAQVTKAPTPTAAAPAAGAPTEAYRAAAEALPDDAARAQLIEDTLGAQRFEGHGPDRPGSLEERFIGQVRYGIKDKKYRGYDTETPTWVAVRYADRSGENPVSVTEWASLEELQLAQARGVDLGDPVAVDEFLTTPQFDVVDVPQDIAGKLRARLEVEPGDAAQQRMSRIHPVLVDGKVAVTVPGSRSKHGQSFLLEPDLVRGALEADPDVPLWKHLKLAKESPDKAPRSAAAAKTPESFTPAGRLEVDVTPDQAVPVRRAPKVDATLQGYRALSKAIGTDLGVAIKGQERQVRMGQLVGNWAFGKDVTDELTNVAAQYGIDAVELERAIAAATGGEPPATVSDAAKLHATLTDPDAKFEAAKRGFASLYDELDPNVAAAIRAWKKGGATWSDNAEENLALLRQLVDSADLEAPELWRGVAASAKHPDPTSQVTDSIDFGALSVGDEIDLDVSSWSSSKTDARRFSDGPVLRVEGARAVPIPGEAEWLTSGSFRVTSVEPGAIQDEVIVTVTPASAPVDIVFSDAKMADAPTPAAFTGKAETSASGVVDGKLNGAGAEARTGGRFVARDIPSSGPSIVSNPQINGLFDVAQHGGVMVTPGNKGMFSVVYGEAGVMNSQQLRPDQVDEFLDTVDPNDMRSIRDFFDLTTDMDRYHEAGDMPTDADIDALRPPVQPDAEVIQFPGAKRAADDLEAPALAGAVGEIPPPEVVLKEGKRATPADIRAERYVDLEADGVVSDGVVNLAARARTVADELGDPQHRLKPFDPKRDYETGKVAENMKTWDVPEGRGVVATSDSLNTPLSMRTLASRTAKGKRQRYSTAALVPRDAGRPALAWSHESALFGEAYTDGYSLFRVPTPDDAPDAASAKRVRALRERLEGGKEWWKQAKAKELAKRNLPPDPKLEVPQSPNIDGLVQSILKDVENHRPVWPVAAISMQEGGDKHLMAVIVDEGGQVAQHVSARHLRRIEEVAEMQGATFANGRLTMTTADELKPSLLYIDDELAGVLMPIRDTGERLADEALEIAGSRRFIEQVSDPLEADRFTGKLESTLVEVEKVDAYARRPLSGTEPLEDEYFRLKRWAETLEKRIEQRLPITEGDLHLLASTIKDSGRSSVIDRAVTIDELAKRYLHQQADGRASELLGPIRDVKNYVDDRTLRTFGFDRYKLSGAAEESAPIRDRFDELLVAHGLIEPHQVGELPFREKLNRFNKAVSDDYDRGWNPDGTRRKDVPQRGGADPITPKVAGKTIAQEGLSLIEYAEGQAERAILDALDTARQAVLKAGGIAPPAGMVPPSGPPTYTGRTPAEFAARPRSLGPYTGNEWSQTRGAMPGTPNPKAGSVPGDRSLVPYEPTPAGELVHVPRSFEDRLEGYIYDDVLQVVSEGVDTPEARHAIENAIIEWSESAGRPTGLWVDEPPTYGEILERRPKTPGVPTRWETMAREAGFDRQTARRGTGRKARPAPALRDSKVWHGILMDDFTRDALKRFGTDGQWEEFSSSVFEPYMRWFRTQATVGRGPGFVIRNLVGGLSNARLVGATSRDMLDGMQMSQMWKRAYRAADRSGLFGQELFDDRAKRFAELVTERYGDQAADLIELHEHFQALGLADIRTMSLTELADFTRSSRLFDQKDADELNLVERVFERTAGGIGPLKTVTSKTSDWTKQAEHALRFGSFMAGVRRYGIEDGGYAASMLTKASQFDYGDLSSFELNVMRQVIPFYTFTRKNLPLQFRGILTDPAKFVHLQRLMDTIEDYNDTEDGSLGDAYDDVLPEWFAENLGFVTDSQFGGGMLGIRAESPKMALEQWLPGSPQDAWRDKRKQLDTAVSSANPLVDATVGILTGRDAYTGQEVGTGDGSSGTLDYFARQLSPLYSNIVRLAPTPFSTERDASRRAGAWASTVFGAPVTVIDEASAVGALRARANELLEESSVAIEQVSAELGIDPTELKRLIREHGIEQTALILGVDSGTLVP